MQPGPGVSPRHAAAQAVANVMTVLPLKDRLKHPDVLREEQQASARKREKREALLQMHLKGSFATKHNEAVETGFLAGRLKRTMAEQQEERRRQREEERKWGINHPSRVKLRALS